MKQYPLRNVEYYETFSALVDSFAEKYPENPAVSWFDRGGKKHSCTYGELAAQIYALREALRETGLAGKHIAIVGENSCEWLVAYLAVICAGGAAVCVDIEQSDDTICQMLRMADTAAVFASASYRPICEKVLPEEQVFALEAGAADGAQSLEELCRLGRAQLLRQETAFSYAAEPDQMAAIVFTSGTTSLPKPVMLTHRNILTNAAESAAYVEMYGRIFTHLPLYHTYGMTCAALHTLFQGYHLFLNGNLWTLMRDLLLSQADTILTVPLILESLRNQIWKEIERAGETQQIEKRLKAAERRGKIGMNAVCGEFEAYGRKVVGTLRVIISGGAALHAELAREYEHMGIAVLQGYGITECSPLLAVNRNQARKTGSVGFFLPGFEYRLEEDEILVKGPSVMAGYYNAPELTAEAMENGWFHTGDLGSVDSDGFLFLTGRSKSLIVLKNGKKVSPEKMEALLYRIPMVKEVIVSGAAGASVADDLKLTATVYPDPELAGDRSAYEILEEIQKSVDEINATLPTYQQIQTVSIRRQPFEKTAAMKIKRYTE